MKKEKKRCEEEAGRRGDEKKGAKDQEDDKGIATIPHSATAAVLTGSATTPHSATAAVLTRLQRDGTKRSKKQDRRARKKLVPSQTREAMATQCLKRSFTLATSWHRTSRCNTLARSEERLLAFAAASTSHALAGMMRTIRTLSRR